MYYSTVFTLFCTCGFFRVPMRIFSFCLLFTLCYKFAIHRLETKIAHYFLSLSEKKFVVKGRHKFKIHVYSQRLLLPLVFSEFYFMYDFVFSMVLYLYIFKMVCFCFLFIMLDYIKCN